MMELNADILLKLREELPKPIHTLWIATSLFDKLKDTFESGHQLGLGSIRLITSPHLPEDIAIGERGQGEIVIIKLGGKQHETRS